MEEIQGRIDTVVFDIGNVLMKYDWPTYLHALAPDEEVYEKVADAVFRNPAWVRHDKGLMNEAEELEDFISNAPDCEDVIRKVYDTYGDTVTPCRYAAPWVKELRDRGYRVYALSNWHYHMFLQCRDDMMEFLKLMDGYMFSFDVHLGKPDEEIFRLLCRRYVVDPLHSVFIDDTQPNVDAARALGFNAIRFETYTQARRQLEALLCM